MPLRQAIFWIHLFSGLIAGAVIVIMSVTGIAIAFEEEILAWTDREVRRVAAVPAGTPPREMAELRTLVERAHPGFVVTQVTVPRAPQEAYAFFAGREGPVYVDPYTGIGRETRTRAVHDLIHTLEEWHRWLGAKNGPASTGRLVTGIANLAFLVLCLTGLYLWFPRKWSRRGLRPLLWFVGTYRGKARDFNWHNVVGFWFMPALAVLAATAVVISFEWGHRLVFTLAGEEAPKSRNYGMMAVPPPILPTPAEGAPQLPFEAVFARVAGAFPEWQSIDFEFPASDDSAGVPTAPLDFGVTLPDFMPSRAYVPVKADPFTGAILQAVRFQDRSPGLQARVWIRFIHTGAAFGWPGKIIATVATAASLILVWTGIALSWRRFFRKRTAASA